MKREGRYGMIGCSDCQPHWELGDDKCPTCDMDLTIHSVQTPRYVELNRRRKARQKAREGKK